LRSAIGFGASLFAVCCQVILLATLSFAPQFTISGQAGGSPICHADTDDTTQPVPQAPSGHHEHDCALCAVCIAQSLQLAMASPQASLSDRHSAATIPRHAAQPRAPPVHPVAAAPPRGPPN
jgi:hypothetical protein